MSSSDNEKNINLSLQFLRRNAKNIRKQFEIYPRVAFRAMIFFPVFCLFNHIKRDRVVRVIARLVMAMRMLGFLEPISAGRTYSGTPARARVRMPATLANVHLNSGFQYGLIHAFSSPLQSQTSIAE